MQLSASCIRQIQQEAYAEFIFHCHYESFALVIANVRGSAASISNTLSSLGFPASIYIHFS